MILTATRSQNCNFEISVNGVRIQQTDSINYLGVLIDNKLSWKPQISSLCRKLSQACGIVCKIRHFSDIKIFRLIYCSLFHSHLQYCISDWGRAYKTVIQPEQVLQNRIVKYMTFSNRTSSASNISKLLKILQVSDLYQLNLEKFMYKYNADILPSSFDKFFSKLYNIHDHDTRQQVSWNFYHKRVRTDYGKKMLQYVGPVAWGCISNNIKMLPLHTFSNQVKNIFTERIKIFLNNIHWYMYN